MAKITLGGNAVNTAGDLPAKGEKLPNFNLTNGALEDKTPANYTGKKLVLNIFPSVDTGVCAASVRAFNQKASQKDNTVVLNISRDMPFAFKRFCAAEGLEGVETLSELRDATFSENYKVRMIDGGMKDFFSRAVIVADENGTITHTEQVPEIGQEPDYETALAAL